MCKSTGSAKYFLTSTDFASAYMLFRTMTLQQKRFCFNWNTEMAFCLCFQFLGLRTNYVKSTFSLLRILTWLTFTVGAGTYQVHFGLFPSRLLTFQILFE